jgi:hypothetical protein
MKKAFLLVLGLGCWVAEVTAQQKIAVQRGSSTIFYTLLDSALYYAAHDDVIKLPGGVFSTNVAVNARVKIIGEGWHLDSTKATNATVINGSLVILSGGSGGSLEGVQVGGITFGSQENVNAVNNYTIQRCWMPSGSISAYAPVTFLSVIQSVFSYLQTSFIISSWQRGSFDNCSFLNNGINGSIDISNGVSNAFVNNIFFNIGLNFWNQNTTPLFRVHSSVFTNNIFRKRLNINAGCLYEGQITNCTFNNNINTCNPPNSTINTNLEAIEWDTIFENAGTNTNLNSFQSQNPFSYKFRPTFIASNPSYANNGIFGGDLGWKTVPSTPWIYEKTIPTATDASGNLRVTIKAKAQSN